MGGKIFQICKVYFPKQTHVAVHFAEREVWFVGVHICSVSLLFVVVWLVCSVHVCVGSRVSV